MTIEGGTLIAFEGTDGSGKTTQAKMLEYFLNQQKVECYYSREPGGTKLGDEVRGLLLDRREMELSTRAEVFLFLASRAQATVESYIPKMKLGWVIIADRFIDSTIAYQGGGHYLDQASIFEMCKFATKGIVPALTVYIDVPLEVAAARMKLVGKDDKIESRNLDYKKRVRDAYLEWLQKAPYPHVIIDGTQDKMMVHRQVLEKVWGNHLIKSSPLPLDLE